MFDAFLYAIYERNADTVMYHVTINENIYTMKMYRHYHWTYNFVIQYNVLASHFLCIAQSISFFLVCSENEAASKLEKANIFQ